MNKYDKQAIIEQTMYVLNNVGTTDTGHIVYILYFAEQKHLVKYGSEMIPDRYANLKLRLYDKLKSHSLEIEANRKPDMDYISIADKECLDESIAENYRLTSDALELKMRSQERPLDITSSNPLSAVNIAIRGGISDAMLEYLRENLSTDITLQSH